MNAREERRGDIKSERKGSCVFEAGSMAHKQITQVSS